MIYYSRSENDTKKFAKNIALKAAAGDVFCLDGSLGAGKTIFAKGFAEGLGIKDVITSPTFTIVNEYQGSLPLYHFDVYRIGNADEMDDTGYEEYFFGDGVSLIEWAGNIKELIPEKACWITITCVEDYRIISVRGKNYEDISS